MICKLVSDSCQVKNGGCGCRATCSHDATTYAVKCICKNGYTNTGSGSTVVCTGNTSELRALCFRNAVHFFCEHLLDSCQVNNGGCDANAVCSKNDATNDVVCTCKTGYVNTGSGSTVICKGITFEQ